MVLQRFAQVDEVLKEPSSFIAIQNPLVLIVLMTPQNLRIKHGILLSTKIRIKSSSLA